MIKKIFIIAMLCMAIIPIPSCSNGLVIPEPVCEYGSMICETLTFLCSNPTSKNLTESQNDSLIIEMRHFYKSLQKYVHTVSEN